MQWEDHGSNLGSAKFFQQKKKKNQQRGNNQYYVRWSAQMYMEMDPSIDVYISCFKTNGWLTYTAGRRSSDLSGLQGGYEEKGEVGLYNKNHCKILFTVCEK